jgi:hypothetical protein
LYPTNKKFKDYYGDRLAPKIKADLETDKTLAGHPVDPKRFDWENWKLGSFPLVVARSTFSSFWTSALSDEEKFPLKLRDLCVFRLNRANKVLTKSSGWLTAIKPLTCLQWVFMVIFSTNRLR